MVVADCLALRSCGKRYGRKQVLREVSCELRTGLHVISGRSGGGKSTLLRIVATIERPSSGAVFWNAQDYATEVGHVRRMLGYAPQSVDLPDNLSALEFALYVSALKGLDPVVAKAQIISLAAQIGLESDLDTRIGAYSGGMRRRLVFAQALLGEPRLVALDEPTAELDATSARLVSDLIIERARKAVVIVSTHDSAQLSAAADTLLEIGSDGVLSARCSTR